MKKDEKQKVDIQKIYKTGKNKKHKKDKTYKKERKRKKKNKKHKKKKIQGNTLPELSKKNEKVNKHLGTFIKSIKINYIFFTALTISTIIFSTTDSNKGPIFYKIYMGFISLLLAILFSYHIHRGSHHLNYKKMHKDF